MPYYQRIQRGRGIGGFFGSILKIISKAAPLVSKVAANPSVRKIGKQALKSALSIGADALTGTNIENSTKKEFKKTRKKVGKILKDISKDVNDDRKSGKKRPPMKKRSYITKKKRKSQTDRLF